MIRIVVEFKASPDSIDAVTSEFHTLAAATRTEPGAIQFDVFRTGEDPHTIILIEAWRDQRAIDAHMTLAHTKRFIEASRGAFVAGPRAMKLEEL